MRRTPKPWRARRKMSRKKKTKQTFKVGQWVRLSEDGLYKAHLWPNVAKAHGPWKIIQMDYYEDYEDIPSPWSVILEGHEELSAKHDCLFEEHVRLDVFMTAAHEAVERRPRGKKKANTAQV